MRDIAGDSGAIGAPAPEVGRRALLGIAAATAIPVASAVAVTGAQARSPEGAVLFSGPHPAGIAEPPLPFLVLAGFDLLTPHRRELAQLLRDWSALAMRLSSAELSVTLGLGPSLFDRPSLGLVGERPAALQPLPTFPGEALEQAASNGDLCVQVCASSPTAASRAVRSLVTAARPLAGLRWRQVGYRELDGTDAPRGPFDFRDGTANLEVGDPVVAAEQLWVSDGPEWLHGGSYLVVRRIRLLVDTWDRTNLDVQEAMIGRTRDTNRRIGGGHTHLARPESNDGATMLRRSYTYDAGVDVNGLQDTGLIFIAFQRNPAQQFVPVQQRLARHDRLNSFSQHVASALFACPAGHTSESWVGAHLLRIKEEP